MVGTTALGCGSPDAALCGWYPGIAAGGAPHP